MTKPKIVITADYNCAYVSKMAVLIIFPVIPQAVDNREDYQNCHFRYTSLPWQHVSAEEKFK